MSKYSRRDLLRLGLETTVASSALGWWAARGQSAEPKATDKKPTTKTDDTLPMRVLGQTGLRISIFGLGGASEKTPLSLGPHDKAVAIIERALALGVNYYDTASNYGEGKSETALGEVARKHRKQMVIASKTGERTYDGAMRDLETSLRRLQTDHLDVWFMHHVSLPDRDTVPAFGENGALKALEKAKAEKTVRFGGISGHHRTDILNEWLQRHPFDVLLTIVNAVDRHNPDSFIDKVLPVAREHKVGIVAMKIPAYGRLLRPNEGVGIKEAFAYSLSQSGVASGIIACDSIEMLEENVAAARAFTALDKEAQAALEAKTASYWQRASFYRSWT